MANGRLNQSYWQLNFQISVVETENEFVDVLLKKLVQHPLKSTTDDQYELASHDVNRRQSFINFLREYVY